MEKLSATKRREAAIRPLRAPPLTLFGTLPWLLSAVAAAQGDDADLAKQLANPVAALISVPIQANYDSGYGSDDGSVLRINVQPVIPFELNDHWNLISRTILPLVDQNDIPRDGEGESGLADTVQSLFFSPKAATAGGWIWGAGPAFLLPTATDNALGADRWGAGPTAVVLKQRGPWTYGMLGNHINSFAGSDRGPDISATFLQPFLTYITASKTTFALNTESTYDWKGDDWSAPINFNVSQLLTLGGNIISVGGGVRYWLDSPPGGPDDWGFRFTFTLLYPR